MDLSQSCSNHPDLSAGWYCWNCGLPFCEECIQPWEEQYICESCLDELDRDNVEVPKDAKKWPKSHREADVVARFLAFFIDFTLITTITIGLSWLLHQLLTLNNIQTQYLYWIILYLGIILRDAVFPGGSPGKRWVDLYVWNLEEDRPINVLDSIRRNLVLIVFFLDVLVVPFTRERQRVGDLLAGTKVCDRSSRRSTQRNSFYLAGIILLNLVMILSLYTTWIRMRSLERFGSRPTITEREVTNQNIISVLQEMNQRVEQFQVRQTPDGLTVEAETRSAENYYRIRRDTKKLLKKASYKIISEEDPELVFRGRDDVRFHLKILAKSRKE